MLIPIDRPLIDARNFRPAAEQTLTDTTNHELTHNNRRSLHLTISGVPATRTAGNGAKAIQDGSYVGQRLRIMIVDDQVPKGLTLYDDTATAKTVLRGNWVTSRVTPGTDAPQYIELEWKGTYWEEIERADGVQWTASGGSAHAEGYQNNATGIYSHGEGSFSLASGNSAHSEGSTTQATGDFSHAGGNSCNAEGHYSRAFGKDAKADQHFMVAYGGQKFFSKGDAQWVQFICRQAITHSDDSWTTIGLATSSSVGPIIPADTAWTFEAQVVGATVDMGKVFSYLVNGTIDRIANTTTLRASNVTTLYETDTDFDCQAVADDTNEALSIQVKDSTSGSDAVRWVATIKLTQITFT